MKQNDKTFSVLKQMTRVEKKNKSINLTFETTQVKYNFRALKALIAACVLFLRNNQLLNAGVNDKEINLIAYSVLFKGGGRNQHHPRGCIRDQPLLKHNDRDKHALHAFKQLQSLSLNVSIIFQTHLDRYTFITC